MSIILLVTAIVSSASAAPWQPSEFPIGFWYGPPATENRLETWQTVKDCNFTFCGPRGGYSLEDNLAMLDFCEQVGIKASIVDTRISWEMVSGENWREIVAEVVGDYGSHPALYGYHIKDEPGLQLFESLGLVSQELEKQDPAHLPYINLFPTYANFHQLGTPTYAEHLDKYLDIVKPRVLSYDHYCLMADGSDRADYFENLELIREYGLRYDTPQWNIILSLPHLRYRDPTEGEMRWQVYTSLAYGMKGIMYFTYWTAEAWEADGEAGIVDSKGKPGRLYAIIRGLNGEIQGLGKTLLGLTSTGVYHTGETPQGATRLGSDAILSLPDDVPLVVGLFEDADDAQFVMIVNRDHDNVARVEATLRPHVTGAAQVSDQDGSLRPLDVTDGKLPIGLAAGGSVLLKLDTDFAYPEPAKPAQRIDFQFNAAGNLEGWAMANALGMATIQGEALTVPLMGPDPHMTRSFMSVPPGAVETVKVRMKLPACQASGQFFWTTSESPRFADDKHITYPVIPDGEWHEYEIPVGEHALWSGQTIRAIRLDPTTGGGEEGAVVEIDWIVGE